MEAPPGWDKVEMGPGESKENRVLEPEKLSEYLLNLIDTAPSAFYSGDDKKSNQIKERRELLHSCAERIEEIGSDLTRAFIESYAKHGLEIKGGVRFYIVGGRLEAKRLAETSDLDCAFTVVDPKEDMRPKYGEDSAENLERKKAGRKEFVYAALREIGAKHGFMIKDTLANGEVVEGSLLEPKEYGSPDEEFKKRNLPAVLICEVK